MPRDIVDSDNPRSENVVDYSSNLGVRERIQDYVAPTVAVQQKRLDGIEGSIKLLNGGIEANSDAIQQVKADLNGKVSFNGFGNAVKTAGFIPRVELIPLMEEIATRIAAETEIVLSAQNVKDMAFSYDIAEGAYPKLDQYVSAISAKIAAQNELIATAADISKLGFISSDSSLVKGKWPRLDDYVYGIAEAASRATEVVLSKAEISTMGFQTIEQTAKRVNDALNITIGDFNGTGLPSYVIRGAGKARLQFGRDDAHDAEGVFRINALKPDGTPAWAAWYFDARDSSFVSTGKIFAAGKDVLGEINNVYKYITDINTGGLSAYVVKGGGTGAAIFQLAADTAHNGIFNINVRKADGSFGWGGFQFDANNLSFAAGGKLYAKGRDILAEIDAIKNVNLAGIVASVKADIQAWVTTHVSNVLAGLSWPVFESINNPDPATGPEKWFHFKFAGFENYLPVNVPAFKSFAWDLMKTFTPLPGIIDTAKSLFAKVKAVFDSIKARFSTLGTAIGNVKSDFNKWKTMAGEIIDHTGWFEAKDAIKVFLGGTKAMIMGGNWEIRGTPGWPTAPSQIWTDTYFGLSGLWDAITAAFTGAVSDITAAIGGMPEMPSWAKLG